MFDSIFKVFSSELQPSIQMGTNVQKFCAKHQQVVSCVKRLTSDVVPCAGKNWAELHIDFSTTCMYMYHITPRRDSICHLRKACSLFYGITPRHSIHLYLSDSSEFTDLVHYSYMIATYDYPLKTFFLSAYTFLINVIFFFCRTRIGF